MENLYVMPLAYLAATLLLPVIFGFLGITLATIWVYHVVKWLNWIYRPKPAKQNREIKIPDYEAEAALAQSELAVPEPLTTPPAPPAVADNPEDKYGPK